LKKGRNFSNLFVQAAAGSEKVDRLKKYMKLAGFNFFPYKKVLEECGGKHNKLADRLIEFLHEKGLKGSTHSFHSKAAFCTLY
jgi:hypothetical protein